MQNHFPALREPPVDWVRVSLVSAEGECVCVGGISHGPALLPVGPECNPAVKGSFFGYVCFHITHWHLSLGLRKQMIICTIGLLRRSPEVSKGNLVEGPLRVIREFS